MKVKNLLENLPADLSNEVIEQLIEHDQVKIERIVSRGHTSPASGWYQQAQSEWVMVISGQAELTFDDGSKANMNAGDYVLIEANRKHKVSWTDPEQNTVWLAVHYD